MHRRGALQGPIVVALFAAMLALSAPAFAQTEFLPAYDDKPLAGPAKAKGAVIWNHGLSRLSESEANTRHRPQGAHTYGNTRRRSEPLVTILFQARVGNRQRSSSARVIQGPRGEGTFPHLEGLAGPLSRRWQQDGQLHEMRPRSFPGSDKTAQLRPSPTAVFCRTPVRAQIRSPRPPSRGPRGARNQHTIRCEGRLTESPLVNCLCPLQVVPLRVHCSVADSWC